MPNNTVSIITCPTKYTDYLDWLKDGGGDPA